MKAQDFLKQYKKQKSIIANCWAEVARWEDIALSVTAHSSGERVQSSGSKQKMADAVVAYSDIESEIKQRIAKANEIQREILEAIEQLKEAEYDVLHKLYIQDMTFKEVAVAKDRSMSWTTSTHGNALTHLQRLLDEREKV